MLLDSPCAPSAVFGVADCSEDAAGLEIGLKQHSKHMPPGISDRSPPLGLIRCALLRIAPTSSQSRHQRRLAHRDTSLLPDSLD